MSHLLTVIGLRTGRKGKPHEAMVGVGVGGIMQSSSSDGDWDQNVIWAFHAECAMDRCLYLNETGVNHRGKVQQPARATGTGSVSLSFSTPEYSAEKQDKTTGKDPRLGSSQWTLKIHTEKLPRTKCREKKSRVPLGTYSVWNHLFPEAICHPSLVVFFYSTSPHPPGQHVGWIQNKMRKRLYTELRLLSLGGWRP